MKQYFKINNLELTKILVFELSYSDVVTTKTTELGGTVTYPKKIGKTTLKFTVECTASECVNLKNILNSASEFSVSFYEFIESITTKTMRKTSSVVPKCMTMQGDGIYQVSCTIEEV